MKVVRVQKFVNLLLMLSWYVDKMEDLKLKFSKALNLLRCLGLV